jgi:hypothetical protein
MMVNIGFLTLRNVGAAPDSTIIVTGLGRSGTSMVAQLLHRLGIPMGEEFPDARFEDRHMTHAILYHEHDGRIALTADRNARLPRHGFKFPSIHNHLHPAQIARDFRNPRVVYISRDQTAQCRSVMLYERRTDPAAVIRHMCDEYVAMTRFLELLTVPTLMISYETLKAFPSSAVRALCIFCGLHATDDAIETAITETLERKEEYARLHEVEEG